MDTFNLSRFIDAQETHYGIALAEITNGKKETHWMWFIFPQIKGLGKSEIAILYALTGRQEAIAYLNHPILGARLEEITLSLLKHTGKSANRIFGFSDDLKLKSSMTLFAEVSDKQDNVFRRVLNEFFNGEGDGETLRLLSGE